MEYDAFPPKPFLLLQKGGEDTEMFAVNLSLCVVMFPETEAMLPCGKPMVGAG